MIKEERKKKTKKKQRFVAIRNMVLVKLFTPIVLPFLHQNPTTQKRHQFHGSELPPRFVNRKYKEEEKQKNATTSKATTILMPLL